jgi:hypothetical protein
MRALCLDFPFCYLISSLPEALQLKLHRREVATLTTTVRILHALHAILSTCIVADSLKGYLGRLPHRVQGKHCPCWNSPFLYDLKDAPYASSNRCQRASYRP